jgi:hypothetical protein
LFLFVLNQNTMIEHTFAKHSFLVLLIIFLAIFALSFKHLILIRVVTFFKHLCGLINRERLQYYFWIVLLLGMEACADGPLNHVVGCKDGVEYTPRHANLFLYNFKQFLMICLDYFQQVRLSHLN